MVIQVFIEISCKIRHSVKSLAICITRTGFIAKTRNYKVLGAFRFSATYVANVGGMAALQIPFQLLKATSSGN